MNSIHRGVFILAVAVAGCAAPPAQTGVVGHWSEAGTGAILRLGGDGIVEVVTGVETTRGTYSVDSADFLTLRFDGTTVAKPGPLTVGYVLQGSQMILRWPNGDTMHYTRLEK